MWKYVTGCVRETLQRSANYFDIRCGAGLASNQNTSVVPRSDNAIKEFQEQHRCSGSTDDCNAKKDNQWFQKNACNSWINVFMWSGAIVLGWYTSQLVCLTQKRRGWNNIRKSPYCNFVVSNTKSLHSVLLSHYAQAQPPTSITNGVSCQIIDSSHVIDYENNSDSFAYNVSNDVTEGSHPDSHDNHMHLDKATSDLTDVLSSIENKLALASIDRGDLKEGLVMLQSAARRNHAPALFNLAICYEKGLGIKQDDRMAMELYCIAASRDHPTAMYNLAIFHGQGRGGLKRDSFAAERLLHLAAARGQEDAIKALAKISPAPKEMQKCTTGKQYIDIPQEFDPTESFLNLVINNDPPNYEQQSSVLIY